MYWNKVCDPSVKETYYSRSEWQDLCIIYRMRMYPSFRVILYTYSQVRPSMGSWKCVRTMQNH